MLIENLLRECDQLGGGLSEMVKTFLYLKYCWHSLVLHSTFPELLQFVSDVGSSAVALGKCQHAAPHGSTSLGHNFSNPVVWPWQSIK